MKKSTRSLLIATTVLVAAAFATGPASASAAAWLREGSPLKEEVSLPLSGGEVLEVGSSALLCDTTATMTTEGGSSASIAAYAIETGSCLGLAGEFEGCEVTAATPKTLPWGVTVNSETLTAKGFGVTYSFDAGCSIHELETSFPELTLTPEEPTAIRLFHFGQTGTGKVDGEATSITDGGALDLSEADFGIYGIG